MSCLCVVFLNNIDVRRVISEGKVLEIKEKAEFRKLIGKTTPYTHSFM